MKLSAQTESDIFIGLVREDKIYLGRKDIILWCAYITTVRPHFVQILD